MPVGSHPCEECGKTISANKARCLDCQAQQGWAKLAAEGHFAPLEQVKELIKHGR